MKAYCLAHAKVSGRLSVKPKVLRPLPNLYVLWMYLRFSSTMHAGHGDRQRYIPVPDISNKLGVALCGSLPACHALTGCDTTRSLFRIGKTTTFNKTALCRGANLRPVQALMAIQYITYLCTSRARKYFDWCWVCGYVTTLVG